MRKTKSTHLLQSPNFQYWRELSSQDLLVSTKNTGSPLHKIYITISLKSLARGNARQISLVLTSKPSLLIVRKSMKVNAGLMDHRRKD